MSAALPHGVVRLHTEAVEPLTPHALQYRLHSRRPGGGQDFTEWCIEEQLTLAFDCDEADAYSVLAAFNPSREGQVLEAVEQLIYLSCEVARAEEWGSTAEFHAAYDDYRDALHSLARTLRGAA